LDAEVLVAQERLIDLRAAAKTSAIEEQQDLLEEHAVASAMQGLSLAPEPDKKPSAEEQEVGWRAELTGRIQESERRKEAAVAEEDYLKAAEIKRSIAELVDQQAALERAMAEEDTKKAAAEHEAGGNECVVCLDAPKTHILAPCFHKCLCEECAERIPVGGQCPVCRAVVISKGRVYN